MTMPTSLVLICYGVALVFIVEHVPPPFGDLASVALAGAMLILAARGVFK